MPTHCSLSVALVCLVQLLSATRRESIRRTESTQAHEWKRVLEGGAVPRKAAPTPSTSQPILRLNGFKGRGGRRESAGRETPGHLRALLPLQRPLLPRRPRRLCPLLGLLLALPQVTDNALSLSPHPPGARILGHGLSCFPSSLDSH